MPETTRVSRASGSERASRSSLVTTRTSPPRQAAIASRNPGRAWLVPAPTVGRGFFGWTTGAAVGGFLALQQFDRIARFGPLLIAWIALLALLWVLGGIAYAVRRG